MSEGDRMAPIEQSSGNRAAGLLPISDAEVIEDLRAEVKRLRGVLAFYAEPSNWGTHSGTNRESVGGLEAHIVFSHAGPMAQDLGKRAREVTDG